ncbi:MAG TPA: VTT domain-containing protein [Taishania sp.]|nr:VTT domain-containing protein [Taishania sp.]HNS41411.1 VTT domain-containing protein [Taishania sp.]
MDVILSFFENLMNPDWIMHNGGLYLVLAILFIETGVFFGFVLPGDPLLFISGIVLASVSEAHYPFENPLYNLPFWMALFVLSTVLGNFFGYWFGNKFKFLIDRKHDTWFLKQKHLQTARDFYDKKGGFTIAVARFLPIIRTFAPIVAGTINMNVQKFAIYNVIGAVLWVGSLTTLGYLLGDIPWVKHNLEFIILGIVLVVTTPVIVKFFFKKQ